MVNGEEGYRSFENRRYFDGASTILILRFPELVALGLETYSVYSHDLKLFNSPSTQDGYGTHAIVRKSRRTSES